jgi:tRNA (mo5U34)-methyltransferase
MTSVDAEIAALGPWFHNLHLPDGVQTAPGHFLGDYPQFKSDKLARSLPEDLSGHSVLDIGCNAGFFSFELARRGARVLGIDADARYLRQAKWAARRLGLESRVEFREAHVLDLLALDRSFDLVWFTGVFYHLRYPVLALDLVRQVTRRLMMFQSLTMPGGAFSAPADLSMDERERLTGYDWPKMAYIEHQLAGDWTNWWAPNASCVEALLRTAGFNVVARPEHEFYLCEPATPRFTHELERLRGLFETFQST